MKKIISVLAAMLIGFCAFAYEFDGNTYLSGAADFDYSRMSIDNGSYKINFNSFGLDANCAYYLLGNLGAYASVGYNYTTAIFVDGSKDDGLTNTWLFDGSVGLTYKFNIASNQQLAIGAGFAFWQWTGKSSKQIYYSGLGASADLMYRFFLTDKFYLVGGTKGSYIFGLTGRYAGSEDVKLPDSNAIMVRPYIGIGGRI